jgi:AcrR family transcriptional regulator
VTQAGRVPAQDRSKRTRLKIIETSASVLERRGYAATSLDEIAVEMGMSRGVLYHHFRSKAELTEAVVQSHYERWDDLTNRVRERELPPLMRIIALTNEVARNSQIDPVVRAGLRMQLEHAVIEKDLGRALATPYVKWIEHLAVIVADGQAAGEIIRDNTAADLASNLVESYFGIQYVSFRLCNGVDLLARVHRWWNILLPAIATPAWLTSNQQLPGAAETLVDTAT